MFFDDVKAGAQRNYPANGVDVYIWQRSQAGNVALAQPIVMAEQVEDGAAWRPLVTLPLPAAQMLIDELWNAGLRPTHAKATDETTAAQRAHIEDLRMVVDRLLGIMAAPAQRGIERLRGDGQTGD